MVAETIQALSMIATAWLIMRYGLVWVLNHDKLLNQLGKNVQVAVVGIVCTLIVAAVGATVGFFLGL